MRVTIYEGIEKIINIKRELKSQILPLENAIGKISSTNLYAKIPLPIFNNSAMDGYGLKGDFKEYKIVGKILAGDKKEIECKKKECIKITTGAMVPECVDTIIPQENVEIKENKIFIKKPVKKGANIRYMGEDIEIDEPIIKQGEQITSNYIPLLSSQGITHIRVFQIPRVAIIASGNELKMPYENLEDGQIYNSNIPYLFARLKELGCDVSFIGKAQDNLEDLKKVIENALNFDLIITSGGISVGEADYTKEAFKFFSFESIFEKVDIKPGKPTTFGKIKDTFVLNLPGNPLALAINFEIFGKVLVNILAGREDKYLNYIECEIDSNFNKNKPVPTALPGYFDGKRFKVAKKFAPNMVNVLNYSNGFIILDKMEIKKGEIVKFLPINWHFYSSKFVKFFS